MFKIVPVANDILYQGERVQSFDKVKITQFNYGVDAKLFVPLDLPLKAVLLHAQARHGAEDAAWGGCALHEMRRPLADVLGHLAAAVCEGEVLDEEVHGEATDGDDDTRLEQQEQLKEQGQRHWSRQERTPKLNKEGKKRRANATCISS